MQKVECDNCRRLGGEKASGWLVLVQLPQETPAIPFVAMLGAGPQPEVTGTFCQLRCVAEYATAKALADSVNPGERDTP